MGSLTAGWSTNPPSETKVLRRSTSSMTRSQVNRYWRKKRSLSREHLEEAHGAAAALGRSRIFSEITEEGGDDNYYPDMQSEGGSVGGSAGGSLPTTPRADELGDESHKAGWWRKSSWAFLNEPPLQEHQPHSYVSQYEVDVRARVTEMEAPTKRSLHHIRSSLSIF